MTSASQNGEMGASQYIRLVKQIDTIMFQKYTFLHMQIYIYSSSQAINPAKSGYICICVHSINEFCSTCPRTHACFV